MKKSHFPKVAFFMSCYNHEKYIREAMDSIVNQTYPHWELFVANDGSTDKTGEIIASYQDPRIHFYDLKENTKFAGAIELLYDEIRERDFDFVHSMASDDIIDVNKLERQIAFFEDHPQYAACFTWDRVIFSDGAQGYKTDYSHHENRSRYQWLNHFFHYGNCMNGNSPLIRKDVFYEVGTLNERYIVAGDFRCWYQIALRYPIYLIKEPLTYYRRHGSNLSNHTLGSALCFMEESYRIVKDIIYAMDEKTFHRAHYSRLIYKSYSCKEELIAAKFILLVNDMTADKIQAAIDLYFDHCENRTFINTLKDKYAFDNDDFTKLKETGGLTYAANDISRRSNMEMYLPQGTSLTYSPRKVLFDAIGKGIFDMETFGEYMYTAVKQLIEMGKINDEIREMASHVMGLCKKMRQIYRDSLSKRNVLFVVAASSPWRFNRDSSPIVPNDVTQFYIAFVNKIDIEEGGNIDIEKVMKDGNGDTDEDCCNVEYVKLFDEEDQALIFGDEIIPGLTDICYVDSFNPEYECYEMATGYSLKCEQLCIMSKEDYDLAVTSGDDMLQMMSNVYYY